MSDDLSDILDDDPIVRDELGGVIELLGASRPVPRAAFRGELSRRLHDSPTPASARLLWLRVLSFTVTGVLLLALVGLGVDHNGPLAPGTSTSARGTQAQADQHAIIARSQSPRRD